MEYILDARQEADFDEIFMRGYAPYRKLTSGGACRIPSKYLSSFGVKDCPEKGFHILRRTAATKLFEINAASSVISASLGHIDPGAAEVYLATDQNKMRKCSLGLSGIECNRKELS